jgi:malate synthase
MAMKKVADDKVREVVSGHDGTWVAHPALVSCAKVIFDKHMATANQIASNPGLAGASVSEAALLQLPNIPYGKAITSDGLQHGVTIVLHYTEAWLRGIGCIPLNNAMEDAATAEISRAQIWQWRHFGIKTQDDGVAVTAKRISRLVDEEVNRQSGGRWRLAGKLVRCLQL